MNKKLLLLFVSVLLGAATCMAQNTLNIHEKTGGVVNYAFSEKPVVTYVDNNLHVATDQESIDYPLSSLDKLTFDDEHATAIGELCVKEKNAEICVYRLDGTLAKRVSGEGEAKVCTSDLPAGTYIIKHGKVTTKLIKR